MIEHFTLENRLSERNVFIRDGAHSRFSNTAILEGLNPVSGLIPFFQQGQMQNQEIIGEPYIRKEDPMQSELAKALD